MFVSGIVLNEQYYHKIVAPILNKYHPNLIYSAGLIGYGSDVLGYDDSISTDHNWGPRMQIFVNKDNIDKIETLKELFRDKLPYSFKNYSTNYTDPRVDNTQKMQDIDNGKVNHLIEINEINNYFSHHLKKQNVELTNIDWLKIPEQVLVELTRGKVFHDGLDKLNQYREKLSYYPPDIRKIRLAAYWNCIANEEPFIGRVIRNNDYYGAKLISNRIVNYLMKICFMLEKKYIVYSKWFGEDFSNLSIGKEIKQLMKDVLYETKIKQIENHLMNLFNAIIKLHNSKDDLPSLTNRVTDFYGRPIKVIMAESIVEKMINSISSEKVRKINIVKVALDTKIDSEDFTDSDLLNTIKY